MAVELRTKVGVVEPPALRTPAVPGLRSVVALLDRPLGPAPAEWFRDHLAPPPHGLERRVVCIAERSPQRDGGPGVDRNDGTRDFARALRACPEDWRAVIGPFESVAASFDSPDVLSVVVDDGHGRSRATRWALRRARGSTLVLPPSCERAPRRALLVARNEHEITLLVAWSRLLDTAVDIELRAVFAPQSDAPHVVMRDLAELRGTLQRARSTLAEAGYRARAEAALSDEPHEAGFGLVVRVARPTLARRWLPSRDARALRAHTGARLLVAPPAAPLATGVSR